MIFTDLSFQSQIRPSVSPVCISVCSPSGGGHVESSPPASPPPTPQVRKRRLYSAVPGRTFIATRSHVPQGPGEIQLHRGERVKGQRDRQNKNQTQTGQRLGRGQRSDTQEGSWKAAVIMELTQNICTVLSIGEGGFWEGSVKGRTGWFPADCVEEVQMRQYDPRLGKHTHAWAILTNTYTNLLFTHSDSIIFICMTCSRL